MIVAAGRDRVVSNLAIADFVRRVPGVARVTIEEALHEILSESDEIRNQFFAVFDNFVDG
jgi:lysophospholipase